MDEPIDNPEDNKPTVFNNKEEFVAEVDALITEGTALTEAVYQFGIRMAKDGMLASGTADAYIGMKATVEILEMLKTGEFLDQVEQKLTESKVEGAAKEVKDITDFPIPKHVGKYLN
jgi:hypothetical protein